MEDTIEELKAKLSLAEKYIIKSAFDNSSFLMHRTNIPSSLAHSVLGAEFQINYENGICYVVCMTNHGPMRNQGGEITAFEDALQTRFDNVNVQNQIASGFNSSHISKRNK